MNENRNTSWKEMTPEQKKQYFMDYYLVKVLIGAGVLLFAAYVIISVMRPEPQFRLRIGVYDTSLGDAVKEDMEYSIRKALSTAERVEIDDSYTSLNDQDLLRVAALSTAKDLDVLIADRKIFEWLAGYGYFKDLSLSFDSAFLSSHSDDLVVCRGLKTGEGGILEENAEGNGAYYSAGIRITEGTMKEWFDEYEEPVLGIIYESDCTADIEKLLEAFEQPGQ